ncbi:hypothetical protein AgCh_023708 [Apium graveolens]
MIMISTGHTASLVQVTPPPTPLARFSMVGSSYQLLELASALYQVFFLLSATTLLNSSLSMLRRLVRVHI